MRYPVVCFDVGFTLLDERTDLHTLLHDIFAELGHTTTVAPADLRAAQQAAQRWYAPRYRRLDNDDWSSDAMIHALWMGYYEELFTSLDPALDHATLGPRLIDYYGRPSQWQPFDDVLPTLEQLRAMGVRIGVVSDWSTHLRGILRGTGLSDWLDWAVISADAGYAKPMRELYAMAVQRAGVAPEQIIHVGDSYHADVLGARSVGMDGAVIDRRRHLSRLDCPLLHDLRELIPLVAGSAV